MALTIVATVVSGTKVTAAWGNSVASAVDELQEINDAICQAVEDSQVINDNTATAISFGDADDVDPLGWHDLGVNPTRITPTIAGWYWVHGWSELVTAQSDVTRRRTFINLNGASSLDNDAATVSGGATQKYFQAVSGLIQANGTTDFFGLGVLQDNSAGQNRAMSSKLLVKLMHRT